MNALARFALNQPAPTHCWRCGYGLDPMADTDGQPVRVALGVWCRECLDSDEQTPEGRHDLRFGLAAPGYVYCLRCRRQLTFEQTSARCGGGQSD